MSKVNDRMIDNMNIHEMQEYLTKYRSDHDTGYIQFLEEQLEKAEKVINHIKDISNKKTEFVTKNINKSIKAYYNDKK